MSPNVITNPLDLRHYTHDLHKRGQRLGFVPTMGALHEGHLTLCRAALEECGNCLVSIFVNPKQFAPHEDFDKYPRTLERDAELLKSIGVQAIFAPGVDVMYPPGFQTSVTVSDISKPLEGEYRPHFFTGVATVVVRLLLLAGADIAYFGEKDYQQLQVIKALQRDLAIPTEIKGVATVREESGLALSSRNAYLSPEQKAIAVQLNKIMADMAADLRDGNSVDAIEYQAQQNLLLAGFEKIDYLTIRDATTLMLPSDTTTAWRVLAAAWLGTTRLIDNMAV